MNKIIRVFTFSFLLLLWSCTFDKEEIPEPTPTPPPPVMDFCDSLNVTYSSTVSSIINTNCAISGCHVSGFGSGDFTNYSGVKAKVDDNGKFKDRVLVQKNMPPSGPLSEEDRDKLQCWLDDGAPNN